MRQRQDGRGRHRGMMVAGPVVGLVAGVVGGQLARPHWAPAASTVTSPEARKGIETLREFSDAFTAVAESAKPAVVSIVVEKRHPGWGRGSPGDQDEGPFYPFRGAPFEFFFGPHGGPYRQPPTIKGGGSGMIVRSDGMILTCNHVVEGADKITVYLADGRSFPAKIKGTDPKTDLAVIEVDAKDLPVIELGDSDKTRVGEWVIAMGSPYGFDYTVTAGIVSAKGRRVTGGEKYEDFIQTDASINPGNSGGPLLNLDGEVIGINTMIAGIGTGIGFAVPSSLAKTVVDQLVTTGKVVRPWIGVGIQPVTPEMVSFLKLDERKGALVSQVYSGSPAEKAGLQIGDVIVKVDDTDIDDPDTLVRSVLRHDVGDKLKLLVVRNGKEKRIEVKTGVMPEEPTGSGMLGTGKVPEFGVEVQDLTSEMAGAMGIGTEGGVVVTSVEPGSPAADAGIRRGDVILELNRQPVESASRFVEAAAQAKGDTALLLIGRDGRTFFVQLHLNR